MDIQVMAPQNLNKSVYFHLLNTNKLMQSYNTVATINETSYLVLETNPNSANYIHHSLKSINELLQLQYSLITPFITCTMNKLRFFNHCLTHDKDNQAYWVQTLDLPNHNALKVEVGRMLKIPEKVQSFLSEKKASYKQVLNIAYIPKDILTTVMEWKESTQLSLSYFDNWCRTLKHLSHRQELSLSELLNKLTISNILDGDQSPSQKSKQIQDHIYKEQHPVQTHHNDRIQTLSHSLPYQSKWDPSLEKKELKLTIPIRSSDDLQTISKQLRTHSDTIQSMLDLM